MREIFAIILQRASNHRGKKNIERKMDEKYKNKKELNSQLNDDDQGKNFVHMRVKILPQRIGLRS